MLQVSRTVSLLVASMRCTVASMTTNRWTEWMDKKSLEAVTVRVPENTMRRIRLRAKKEDWTLQATFQLALDVWLARTDGMSMTLQADKLLKEWGVNDDAAGAERSESGTVGADEHGGSAAAGGGAGPDGAPDEGAGEPGDGVHGDVDGGRLPERGDPGDETDDPRAVVERLLKAGLIKRGVDGE